MFYKTICFSIFLGIAVLATTVWVLQKSPKQAMDSYLELMTFTDLGKDKNPSDSTRQTKQKRFLVSKQILYNQDSQRLQSRLSGKSSELMLDQTEKGMEIVEDFKDIQCTMQENFFLAETNQNPSLEEKNTGDFSRQLVRHLSADKASYSYRKGRLFIQDVEMTRYVFPGVSWPSNLTQGKTILKGRANSVEVDLLQKPAFQASGLKATLNEWTE